MNSTPCLLHSARASALALALAVLTVLPVASRAGDDHAGKKSAGIYPPQARVEGKSLRKWIEIYWRWYAAGADAGASVVDEVQLLPLPNGEYVRGSGTPEDPTLYRGHLEFTLDRDSPFVLPVGAWLGEAYNNGLPNDPLLDDAAFLAGLSPLLTIDGKPVLSDANKAGFFIPTTTFHPPALYPVPTDYGAVGFGAFQTVGIIGRPLSRGVHVLHLYEPFIVPGTVALIYDNTWTITVR